LFVGQGAREYSGILAIFCNQTGTEHHDCVENPVVNEDGRLVAKDKTCKAKVDRAANRTSVGDGLAVWNGEVDDLVAIANVATRPAALLPRGGALRLHGCRCVQACFITRIIAASVALLVAWLPSLAIASTLPAAVENYLDQAAAIRRAADRPWDMEAGRLGNLRHVHVRAPNCVVRIVSGSENRVFPGSRRVTVVEQSRVLDPKPAEVPTPRDVVLASDPAQACLGVGACGIARAEVIRSPTFSATHVCFTLQLASAHDMLLTGDNMDVLFERVKQPALRLSVNPGNRTRLWLHDVDIGALSIKANARVEVGGTGRADFLTLDSSQRASAMFMHLFNARRIGVSATTTGTRWSILIGPDTSAGYYQPARAPGNIAAEYGIEIDGALDRLEMPAGRVTKTPLQAETRRATRALRDDMRQCPLASCRHATTRPQATCG
jgi:hypothetical protein